MIHSLKSKKRIRNFYDYPIACIFSSKFSTQGLVEVRTYETHPLHIKAYLQAAKESSEIRRRYLKDHWKLFLQAETGCGGLSDVMHFYTYNNLRNRADERKKMSEDPGWAQFLEQTKPHMLKQRSELFVPIDISARGVSYFPPKTKASTSSIYEIRYHELAKGADIEYYPPISNLLNSLSFAKVSGSELILMATPFLAAENQCLLEVWRYPSLEALERHRVEIPTMLHSKSRVMVPTTFSPCSAI
jgi:hypothetical protein